MSALLEVNGMTKSFGGIHAVSDVSLKLEKDQIVTVMGPNGAGKTTVFNLITGIYTVDSGSVTLADQDMTNKKQEEITRAGIARTFQNIRLFNGLTCLENVMCAHDPLIKYSLLDCIYPSPRKRRLDRENRELALSYLEAIGLQDYKDEDPFSLPYGMQRKLEIARALATMPQVLLLDEPAAGLNTVEVEDLMVLIEKLKKTFNLSILLIDHRMELVMGLSDYIYVLNFGQLLAEGTPQAIQENAEVQRVYVGGEE